MADGLLYIDLHLVHEVTSPQAFESLRLAGRKVRRPGPHAGHGRPQRAHRRLDRGRADRATSSRACRSRRWRATAREFGVPIYSIGSARQGIVHVIGPELGVTQPGMTIVCGDSHTSTHGAFGALAFGIGTSEVEHVLATQTLPQRKPKSMRILYEGELGAAGVTAKDLILGHDRPDRRGRRRRPRDRVRRPADRGAVDGGPDDHLQHDHRGRRPRRDDRARRHHVRVGRRAAPARRKGRCDAAVDEWRALRTDDGASFDTEVDVDACAHLAAGHLGHHARAWSPT